MNNKLTTIRNFRKSFRMIERLLGSMISSESSCCGVSLSQCHLLIELDSVDEVTLNELAELLSLDKSTLSRTVDSLVRDGLVNRVIPPDNRRTIKISLTSQGKQKAAGIHSLCDDYYDRILSEIPENEHPKILQALSRLEEAARSLEKRERGE